MTKRRDFIKKLSAGTAGLAIGGVAHGLPAKNYARIIGAGDRLNIAVVGLGGRGLLYDKAISLKENNVNLVYLCDVMKSQSEKALAAYTKLIGNRPILEKDIRKIISDPKLDAVLNATPDHWHTPGAVMAITAGKHVYVEKPCSHNPHEAEMLVACAKKYSKVVQMGNQYRSVPHFMEIVKEIHNGVIGTAFKATTFLSSPRKSIPVAAKAPVPEGLDWDLFQGPAPRAEYINQIWDYIWHWYGWNYGTAEIMNNGIHEMDIARWALKVEYPEYVDVEAEKRYFPEDGWTMYDTMDATFKFPDKKIIKWDGKSRNAYNTYGSNRGVIIYGSEGTVYVDPFGYKIYNREGTMLKEKKRESETDDGTILHISNFFNAIRGKEKLNSPIAIGAVSNMLANYANIAYRIGNPFEVDVETGRIFNREAMKLWSREYEPGWEPVF